MNDGSINDGAKRLYDFYVKSAESYRVSILKCMEDSVYGKCYKHLEYYRLMNGEEMLDKNKHEHYKQVFFGIGIEI